MESNETIKNLIAEIKSLTGQTQEQIAEGIGYKRAYLSEAISKGGTPKLLKALEIYKTQSQKNKQINLESDSSSSLAEPKGKINHAPKGRLPKKSTDQGRLVPFYDVDFAAGDIEFNENSAIQPAYSMDVPEFSGCTAFRSYSNSMEKLIKSGDILFGTRVEDWKSHLEYGQIYGIICTDKRKYLKYIRRDKDKPDTQFLLKSENEDYDDFTIPKTKIRSLWLIHGWINKRT